MLPQQIVQPRLRHVELTDGQPVDQRGVGVKTDCVESLAGRAYRGTESEMRHTGERDFYRRGRHVMVGESAASVSRVSTLCSQRSFEKSVLVPAAHNRLK